MSDEEVEEALRSLPAHHASSGGPYHGRPGEVVDPAVVNLYRGGRSLEVKPGDIKVGKDGLVQPTHGISVDTDPAIGARFGGANRVKSIPGKLRIIQRGKRDTHFEIVPKQPMTSEEYQDLLRQIELE